ncbi:hypothetical protein [Bradyrhizobium sp.]|uniref:hypothetical protein n=1 Tax=Bradyrhizobium sp. TaxID=376 RepID=UPI002D1FB154|nr:hypothetical protein [Bradyrhizobium sp.]
MPGFLAMRIREENRNMVLLATVTLFTAAFAGIMALINPPPAPAESRPAYLADQTPVRVVGGAPFVPNVNPREHR